MLGTAFSVDENGIASSSGLSQDVWSDRTPEQLMREVYTERVGFTPSHAQTSGSAETKFEDMVDGEERTSTANGLIIQLPVSKSMPPTPSMHALQEWEGYVLETGEEEFAARLFDLTRGPIGSQTGRIQEEEAFIPVSEISDYDVSKLRPGSVFRWVIGYERSASGTKRRVSQIVFRDLPAMTRQDREEGSEWARRVVQSIKD